MLAPLALILATRVTATAQDAPAAPREGTAAVSDEPAEPTASSAASTPGSEDPSEPAADRAVSTPASEQPSGPAEEAAEAGSASPPGSEDLANQLQNPVAELISVPIQSNFELGVGPNEDFQYVLNLQPVIPLSLGGGWSVISRTIVPVISQPELVPNSGRVTGLGDILESVFLAPPPLGPVIFGVGPAALFPSATSDRLGTGKWGMGPTAVVLVQDSGVTAGILANHIWSFAGDEARNDVSLTFLQPFLTYTFPTATTVSVSTETSYDWIGDQWTVPLQMGVSQVVPLGLPVSVGLQLRAWAVGPETAPAWSIRVPITIILPTSLFR